MFTYYSIAQNTIIGEEEVKLTFPNAPTMDPNDLLAQGLIREVVPDGISTIYPQYKNGVLTIKLNPPPYWEDLVTGLITNPFYQRVDSLRESSALISGCMGRISEVAIGSKNLDALSYSIGRLRSALASTGQPITDAEIASMEALLVDCGFPDHFLDPLTIPPIS